MRHCGLCGHPTLRMAAVNPFLDSASPPLTSARGFLLLLLMPFVILRLALIFALVMLYIAFLMVRRQRVAHQHSFRAEWFTASLHTTRRAPGLLSFGLRRFLSRRPCEVPPPTNQAEQRPGCARRGVIGPGCVPLHCTRRGRDRVCSLRRPLLFQKAVTLPPAVSTAGHAEGHGPL